MNLSTASMNKPRVGTCPHGMPLGACPICNGMGGGGGGSSSKANKASGEMSWDECNAVWQQMLRAKEAAQQKKLDAMQAQAQVPITFASKLDAVALKIANLIEKLNDFTQKSQVQSLPKILTKPLVMLAKIAIPLLNVLKNIPVLTQKAINFVQQKLADISDKLNAIFGELKNSNEKKISEKFKNVKKKIKSFFEVFNIDEIDQDKEINEEKDFLLNFSTVQTQDYFPNIKDLPHDDN